MKWEKMRKGRVFKVLGAILLCSAIVPISASANTFSGGRSSAIFSAYYDVSVSQYGYTSIYDDGRTNWNGVSSKVTVSKSSSNCSSCDEYYAGTTANNGLLGYTQPYNSFHVALVITANNTWKYCVLSLYDNQIKASNAGSSGPGLTRAEIVSSVTTHEIGHSLSLAHSPSGTTSVMTANDITDFAPNTYDKNELKSKWGN